MLNPDPNGQLQQRSGKKTSTLLDTILAAAPLTAESWRSSEAEAAALVCWTTLAGPWSEGWKSHPLQ